MISKVKESCDQTILMQQSGRRNTSLKPTSEARSELSLLAGHKFKIMFLLSTLLVAYLSYGVVAIPPFHASCKVDWQFGMECGAVMTKLTNQIKAMAGKSGCANGGEKCLYELTSSTSAQITAKHKTPVKGYVDDLTFTFKGGKSANPCQVHGYSTSETWYAVLDYGTNYCNLENLITGAGLNSTSGYSETTSDSICTQYSSANCDKY